MKNTVRILIFAAALGVCGEVNAQKWLNKIGKALDKVEETANKVDKALNGSATDNSSSSNSAQRAGSAALNTEITQAGAGPFTFESIAAGELEKWNTTETTTDGEREIVVKSTKYGELIKYYPDSSTPQIQVCTSLFKLDGKNGVGSTVADLRADKGDAWSPIRKFVNDNYVGFMYLYGVTVVFKPDDFADGGAAVRAALAAKQPVAATVDDLKPDAKIAAILIEQ